MTSPMNNAVMGLKSYSRQLESISGNVSNADTIGYKKTDQDFLTVVTNGAGGSSRGGGGVKTQVRQTIDQQGSISYTGREMDLAIDGQGMFVANNLKDGSGEFVFTRAGSLRTDERGNFVTANGDVMMVWKLDSEGRRPGEVGSTDTTASSLLSSLTTFNINDITGIASATTKIKMGITLDSATKEMEGAGDKIQFRRGTNSLNKDVKGGELIVPSDDGIGSIAQGDSLNIKSITADKLESYKYGGVVSTYAVNSGAGIYGATTPNLKFVNANDGNTLKIISGGVEKDFVYKSNGSVSTQSGQFDSMSRLAEAINFTPNLTARIADNKLYISSQHGDQDLQFLDGAGGGFVAALGLEDVGADAKRFSTLTGLKRLISNSEGLTSSDSGEGGINFRADSPMGELKIFGDSFSHLSKDLRSVAGSNLVTITDVNHGLNAGDYINVANFTNADGLEIPAGNYMVVDAPDADSFVLLAATNATNGSGGLALPNTSINWTKGSIGFAGVVAPVTDGSSITTLLASNVVQINSTVAHGLVDGDIIYMSGLGTGPNGAVVNDGYYKVSAVAGNDFSVTIENATNAAGNAPVGHNISWQKVMNAADPEAVAFADFGGSPVLTTNGSSIVKVYTPNAAANYQVGDVFHFGNINSTGGEYYNGIFVSNEDSFLVRETGVDARGAYITFEAKESATADGYISDASLANISSNKFSKLFKELSLPTTNLRYGPAYDSNGTEVSPNFASQKPRVQGTHNESLEIYDSLGHVHNFTVTFGKIAPNEWAVEVYANKNKDGSYDIETARSDGQVAAGTLKFNGDGSLSVVSSSLLEEIEVGWENEAETSKIKFDWGTAGFSKSIPGASSYGDVNGMKQIRATSEKRFIDNNGVSPGNLNSITVDKDGIVIAGFSNGTNRKVFEIPLADFMDYNGLSELSGNTYKNTFNSGPINLKRVGSDASIGKIVSQSLEQSNIDLSTELTNMIICQRNYQANTKVVNIANQLLEALDRVI